jgi:transketolase
MLLLKVDNLLDLNGKQIDGATDEVLPMGSIRAKFEAFDWDVLDIKENNIEAIIAGMTGKIRTGKKFAY